VTVHHIAGFTEGEVWVTWDANVKLYPTDGNETPPLAPPYQFEADGYYKIPTNALPFTMYVEGSIESDNAKDTKITAIPAKGGVMGTSDSVTFTVLWIDVDVNFAGQIDQNNNAADVLFDMYGSYDLGIGQYVQIPEGGSLGDGWGWRFEAVGYVSPSDLNPAEFGTNLKLDRDVYARHYEGSNLKAEELFSNEADIPEGNDRSHDEYRDDDHTDSTPRGLIFDLDSPGLFIPRLDTQLWVPEIVRIRFNMKEFGVAFIDDREVRASKFFQAWLRMSFTWSYPSGYNPPVFELVSDVAGDNQSGLGTTSVTWNLQ
ncbi:MAG: hypothetical protein ACRD47_11715, partial [Nitrososphaeraceae archaeon]